MTLTATDNLSGVQNTYYILDGGTQQTYAGAFDVSGDAVHSLSYWSVDAAGNVENAHTPRHRHRRHAAQHNRFADRNLGQQRLVHFQPSP